MKDLRIVFDQWVSVNIIRNVSKGSNYKKNTTQTYFLLAFPRHLFSPLNILLHIVILKTTSKLHICLNLCGFVYLLVDVS